MTDAEWLALYIMQFGKETLFSAQCQEGETEFLGMMRQQMDPLDQRSAWMAIHDACEAAGYRRLPTPVLEEIYARATEAQ